MAPPAMEYRVLGPFEVARGDQAVALGGAKQRTLLAILLTQANHVVALDRIAGLLWGEEAPATADHVIEVYVSQLRRALEPEGKPYRVLLRKPSGYMLKVALTDLDAARFQGLVEEAARSSPEDAATLLTKALAMWRGPALADFAAEPFAISEAARLNELRAHAIEERIEAELALGHHRRLISELQALIEEHPLRERLCGQLMLALYRSGRQAEASDVYQRTRARLVDELGMEPAPELQLILKRILQQDPDIAAPPSASGFPVGTVTFLLTDVEGSTRRWDKHAAAMRHAMTMHDEVLSGQVAAFGGIQVESGREGDSVMAVFTRASDAVASAVGMQRELQAKSWPAGADIHIRVAIHTGEAEMRGGHYYGPAVYRCARLLAIGYGDQVLVSQSTHDLVVDAMAEGTQLRDLGAHRLRDLERPERVFQVVGDGLRADFPPLRSLDAKRHNLPISATRFVGRDVELAEIKERLSAHRMVTLLGAGGTGKTRLALQAAADLVDEYRDGVWLVEMASLGEPELVAQTAAEALGVQEEAGRPIPKALGDWLADKRLLLVLDNCEHVIPAVVELADRILRDCPNVRLLATSREALRVAGEATMRVGALPEADAMLLFAERSSAVQPAFQLTDENAQSVAQICRRVDGIPLAIELAAGRARMMAPAEILARLQDSFRVLAGGSRSEDARHETLKAAMDWSYRLLNEPEKRLFRRISVFMGGCTLDAVEAVCGDDDADSILEVLSQLVDKSLLNPLEGSGNSTRYLVLETVREYSRERLVEHGELESTETRHADFFVELAEEASRRLSGPERARWLKRLAEDVDNLRAVFDRERVPAHDTLRLATALEEFWIARGDLSEGRTRLEAALGLASEGTSTRASALRAAGQIAGAQGDQPAAADYCEQSLSLCRHLRDAEGEAASLQQLGQIAIQLEDFGRARTCLNDALAIATKHGFQRIRSICFWRLGMVALFGRDMRSAREHIQAGLVLGREESDHEMVAMSLLMLGNIALWEGQLEEAQKNLRESLEIIRVEGGYRSVANLLESMAAVAAAAGDSERALKLGGATDALRKRIALVPSSPFHREIRARLQAALDRPGGPDAWQSGSELSPDEAIDYALTEGLSLS